MFIFVCISDKTMQVYVNLTVSVIQGTENLSQRIPRSYYTLLLNTTY